MLKEIPSPDVRDGTGADAAAPAHTSPSQTAERTSAARQIRRSLAAWRDADRDGGVDSEAAADSSEQGATVFRAKDKGKGPIEEHRGRLQVQGADMRAELSWPWTRDKPPPASEALAELAKLQGQCNKAELALRDQAFKDAAAFIARAAGRGVDAPVSQTFQNYPLPPKYKTARVDIEVRKGKAFV